MEFQKRNKLQSHLLKTPSLIHVVDTVELTPTNNPLWKQVLRNPAPLTFLLSFLSTQSWELHLKCDKWILSLQVCLQLCDNSISLHYHLMVMLDWPWKQWSSKNLENASSDLGLCFRVPVAHKQNAEKGMQTPNWNKIREDSSNNRWPQPHLMIVNIYCHTWKRDYWSQ